MKAIEKVMKNANEQFHKAHPKQGRRKGENLSKFGGGFDYMLKCMAEKRKVTIGNE